MKDGWIKLWRRSLRSEVFTDLGLWQMWCYCLLRANHERRLVIVDRKADPVQVERGQFVTGKNRLLADLSPTGCAKPASRSTLVRRLKRLEKLGKVNLKMDPRYTLVTVCNYGLYNDDRSADEPQGESLVNPRRTLGEPQVNPKKKERSTRRKEEQKTLRGADVDFGTCANMNVPDVHSAIDRWIAHKTSRGERYKTPELQIGLHLEKYPTPELYIAAVNNSIMHDYKGLYPPKDSDNGQPTRTDSSIHDPSKADHPTGF